MVGNYNYLFPSVLCVPPTILFMFSCYMLSCLILFILCLISLPILISMQVLLFLISKVWHSFALNCISLVILYSYIVFRSFCISLQSFSLVSCLSECYFTYEPSIHYFHFCLTKLGISCPFITNITILPNRAPTVLQIVRGRNQLLWQGRILCICSVNQTLWTTGP